MKIEVSTPAASKGGNESAIAKLQTQLVSLQKQMRSLTDQLQNTTDRDARRMIQQQLQALQMQIQTIQEQMMRLQMPVDPQIEGIKGAMKQVQAVSAGLPSRGANLTSGSVINTSA